MPEPILHSGIINMYDPFKGIGFIRRSEGKDVFFLYDELPDMDYELTEGDHVTFEIEIKPKGPRAKTMNLIKAIMPQS